MKAYQLIEEFLKGQRCSTVDCGHKYYNHRAGYCDDCLCPKYRTYSVMRYIYIGMGIGVGVLLAGLLMGAVS